MNLKFRIKKSKLVKLLGKSLYSGAKEYLKNAEISGKQNGSEKSFRYYISGDDGRHKVDITYFPDDSTFSHNCSCFSKDFCKHTGAVLIRKFELSDDPLLLNEFTEDRPDIVISLYKEKKPDNRPVVNPEPEYQDDENTAKTGYTDKRYCLVFRIFENEYADNWNIRPGIGSINKDNTITRIHSYNSSKITEPVSVNENKLLECLLRKTRHTDKYSKYINFIKSSTDIKIFSLKNKKYSPVSLYYSDNAVIRFEFAGLKGEKIPYFSLVIDFYNNTDLVYTTSVESRAFAYGLLFYLVDIDKSIVLYNEGDNNFTGFLVKIIRVNNVYKTADIKNLETDLTGKGIRNIKINFTQKQLRITHTIPKPLIEITEYSEGITICLMFDYNGRLFPFERDEKFLRLKNSTDEYVAVERNKDYEESRFFYLKALLANLVIRSIEDSIHSNNFTFSLSCRLNEFILEFAGILLDNGFEIRRSGENQSMKSKAKIVFYISRNMDWLDIKAEVVDSENKHHKINVENGFLDNLFVKSENDYYLISRDDVEKLKRLKARGMDSNGTIRILKHNYSVIDELYEQLEKKDSKIKKTAKLLERLKNFTKIEKIKIPAGFKAKLRNYQKAGLNWLYFLYKHKINGCLADDMGLGKTVQTLALLHKLRAEDDFKNALVVMPVSTMGNWKDEISRFTPYFEVLSYHGQNREKYINRIKKTDIVLTSYSTLRNDIDLFKDFKFTYFILDESQIIKNASSKIYKSVKLINSKHRLSLSGTPIENNTMELWAQIDFLMPGLLGRLKDFKKDFTKPIEEYQDEMKTDILRKTVFPFILRRKKEDVAVDLPDKEEIIHYVEMEQLQREAYNEIKEYYKNKVRNTLEEKKVQNAAIDIFTALLKLRQAAIFPFLADREFASIPSCKFEAFKEIVTDIIAEGHKVLVFSQFVKSLKKIESFFKKMKFNYTYLDGSTGNRKERIQAFQNDDNIRAFLISLKAGGLGINLTAADYVILFDPWWNPALESQAVDRAHRIGQKKKVISYKLIVKDTVEEKILKLQEKKKNLVEDIVSGEKTFFKSLTKRDIMGLFS